MTSWQNGGKLEAESSAGQAATYTASPGVVMEDGEKG